MDKNSYLVTFILFCYDYHMLTQFSRTQLTYGPAAMEKIFAAHIAVFGIGGVGSYVVEALVRTGVGAIDIVDNDTVSLTNINRQLYALHSTLGMNKVDVAEARIHDINPNCKVRKFQMFYLPETAGQFNFTEYDYVVDCIDTVKGKIELVEQAKKAGVPIICSMGAGNKVDPSQFEVADISKTSVCPLARVMRQELKKRGITDVKVVYSKEEPLPQIVDSDTEAEQKAGHTAPGSKAFVSSVAGLLIASEVINDITAFTRK